MIWGLIHLRLMKKINNTVSKWCHVKLLSILSKAMKMGTNVIYIVRSSCFMRGYYRILNRTHNALRNYSLGKYLKNNCLWSELMNHSIIKVVLFLLSTDSKKYICVYKEILYLNWYRYWLNNPGFLKLFVRKTNWKDVALLNQFYLPTINSHKIFGNLIHEYIEYL